MLISYLLFVIVACPIAEIYIFHFCSLQNETVVNDKGRKHSDTVRCNNDRKVKHVHKSIAICAFAKLKKFI